MVKNILFTAAVGDLNSPPFGGGEAGNRRTMRLLNAQGYNVVLLSKYISSKSKIITLKNVINSLIKFSSTVFKFRRKRCNTIIHVSGFSGTTVFWNAWQIWLVRLLGFTVVYELRGGNYTKHYSEDSKIYKFFFKYCLNNSTFIFTQGKENIPLIEAIKKESEIFYYPNYVTNDFFPLTLTNKDQIEIKLLFFGRLSPKKNIDIILDIASILKNKYNKKVKLFLIGNFADKEYKETIYNKISELELIDDVEIRKALPQSELPYFLAQSKYFIFPSCEGGEGHSNSLTEAMSYGCVPIASDQGFSRSVIAEDSLIFSYNEPSKMAKKIISIEEEGSFCELSNKMYNRVKNNYLQSIVQENLLKKYEFIFNHQTTNNI